MKFTVRLLGPFLRLSALSIFVAGSAAQISTAQTSSSASSTANRSGGSGIQNPGNIQTQSIPFRCPDDYPSDEAKRAALTDFINAYVARFPSATVRDITVARYRELVAHSCTSTLQYILGHVGPIAEMLLFNGRDYGPKTEEFDSTTKIWTVRYKENDERLDSGNHGEELIFNFYGWNPPVSPETIAQAFINRGDGMQIIWKFGAPDEITKAKAYFIWSQYSSATQTNGYVYVTKIGSVGSSTFAVTFSQPLSGSNGADLNSKAKAWLLSKEGKSVGDGIGSVGVDPDWQDYLTKPHEQ